MLKPLFRVLPLAIFIMTGNGKIHAQGGGITIECGTPPLEETYCYTANDSQTWSYTLSGDGSLKLIFDLGTIESAVFDNLAIHDGIDASGPILFMHAGGQHNLGPVGSAVNNTNTLYHAVDVTSSSGSLFMEMSSDGSVQCGTTQSYDPWEWRVMCIDCTPSEATFEIVQDCNNFQYFVDVDITSMGSADELIISNSLNSSLVTATGTGIVTAGPFTSGELVQLTVEDPDNELCNIMSAQMVNPLCPTLVCGTTPLEETYCYGPSDNMIWAYGLPGDGQLRLVFQRGTMESTTWDDLRIYDGPDANAPLLFEHAQFMTSEFGPEGSAVNGPGNYYYAVDVLSSGPALFMELTSDGSVQCSNNLSYDPMEWSVSCEGCAVPGVTYTLEPDCEQLVFKATVTVTELAEGTSLQITETTSGESITATEVDAYNFATFFPLDTAISFLVTELGESGCTYESGPLVYTRDSCVINSCGTDNYELCYENNEDRWFTYRSEGDFPVAISFLEGHMLPGDNVTLYNGLFDQDNNIIFTGNNGGNLTGLTANSSNLDHALTLRIRSNEEGSCTDGEAIVPLRWDIGCGYVGMVELNSDRFDLYPNPSNGQLTISLVDHTASEVTIRVIDMSGRRVHEQVELTLGARSTLDLASLQNGQYILQLLSAEWIATRTFQIMR